MRTKHTRRLALVSVWLLLLPAGARAGRDPLTDSLDIAIPAPSVEFENTIFASPLNSNVLLVGNRGPNGATGWISQNGGLNWTGSSDPVNGTNSGEPSCAISRQGGVNGRFFVGYRSTSDGVAAGWKDSPGSGWTSVSIFNDPLWVATGNHMWPDNRPSGQYAGQIYDARIQLPSPADPAREVWVSWSTNNGLTWPNQRQIHPPIGTKRQAGVNIHTGPAGQVYAVWTVSNQNGIPEKIAFKRSLDGSDSWLVPPGSSLYIQSIIGLTNLPGKTMAANSYPSMTVNQDNGDM